MQTVCLGQQLATFNIKSQKKYVIQKQITFLSIHEYIDNTNRWTSLNLPPYSAGTVDFWLFSLPLEQTICLVEQENTFYHV